MLEEIKYSGQWWSPANPDNKVQGVLNFNQSTGARLELDGALEGRPNIINGLSFDNTKITLHDCIVSNPNEFWGNTPIMQSYIYAHRIYLGIHFTQQEDIKFKVLYCQMSTLNEWLRKSGFSFEREVGGEVIKYKPPEAISVLINPELRIAIDFWCSSSYRYSAVNLKQVARVAFHTIKAQSIDDYLRLLHHFRNFLCLATQVSTFSQEISGFVNEELPSSEVKILGQLDAPISTKDDVYNSLFTFTDVESKFASCLQNWYKKYEILEPVCQLYFGALYGRFVYLNLKFLCLVQALESYHRRTTTNRELPKEQHKERICNILKSVPNEYKEWLSKKLAWSNEPTLQARLETLCDSFAISVNSIISDKDSFIRKVVDNRNYLTHYVARLKKKTLKGKELFITTETLRAMVEMCLLREVGFSEEEINNLICKHYQDRLKYYER